MFVSQVILSGITLEPSVEQLVTIKVALADSNMMMQLCRNSWEVKKPSVVRIIIGHTYQT
jgi:hypothetical protein